MSEDVVLRCEDLTMVYGEGASEILALKDVSLDVHEFEFLSIVGPSGCGKSTLLKLFAGLLSQKSGQLLVRKTPVNSPVKGMGIVFQSPVLLPWRSVLSNVMLPSEFGDSDAVEAKARAEELIRMVGLGGFETKRPYELSGGMQQRVAICRALLKNPDFLLMDEPFGALDALTREKMNVELLNILQGSPKTVLFVTHSIPEAVFLSDRVAVMSKRPGRITSVVDIKLPRPRNISMLGDPEFASITMDIRKKIEFEMPGENDSQRETGLMEAGKQL